MSVVRIFLVLFRACLLRRAVLAAENLALRIFIMEASAPGLLEPLTRTLLQWDCRHQPSSDCLVHDPIGRIRVLKSALAAQDAADGVFGTYRWCRRAQPEFRVSWRCPRREEPLSRSH